MYCRKCGKEIKDDASFCPYCGSPVEHNQADTVTNKDNASDIKKSTPDNRSKGHMHISHKAGITIGVIAVIAIVIIFGVSLYQDEQKAEQERILAEQEAEQERILAEQEAEEKRKLSDVNVIAVQRAINIVDDFLYGNKIATVAWLEMSSAISSMEEAETEESVEITDNVKTCMKTLLNELGRSRVAEGETGDRSVILENRNKIAEYAGLE